MPGPHRLRARPRPPCFPRRTSAPSIRSSWTSVAMWTSSTATPAATGGGSPGGAREEGEQGPQPLAAGCERVGADLGGDALRTTRPPRRGAPRSPPGTSRAPAAADVLERASSLRSPCGGRRCRRRGAGTRPRRSRGSPSARPALRAGEAADARGEVRVGLATWKDLAQPAGSGPRTRAGRSAASSPRGRVISRIPTRPPGRSTRRSSASPCSRSATLRTPKPTVAASNDASSNGSSSRSPWIHSISRVLPPRALEHPLGEVEADHVRRRPSAPRPRDRRCRSRRRALGRPAQRRCRTVSRRQRWSRPDGHHAVHQVVDRRDPVEHRADAFGRERAGLVRHDWPQREMSVLSSPSWSRIRATMKSTRSSIVSAPW